MRKAIWRTAAATAAVGTVVAVIAVLPTGASAAPGDAQSTAFGISAHALANLVNVGPVPTSAYPPGATNTLASANLGVLGTVGLLTATTNGDTSGNSSATGSAANVALTPTALITGFPAVTATLISASCTASGTTVSGSSTFANATVGGIVVDSTPGPNTVLINALGVTVTLNEQSTSGGKLTVNALHIRVLGPQGIVLADVIIGQATCGPNVPVAPVDAFSFQNLPLILGGLGVVVLIGFGLRTGTRRLRGLV